MASIEISEAKGVRSLHFGSPWVQGAMRIARPWALELEYTRQMMAPLLLHDDAWPATVLQIGLGAGSLTRFLHRHRPNARQVIVELSTEVLAAARQFFKLPEDREHIDIRIAEGHDFLAGTRSRYDLILVDAYDDKGRAGMVDSVPFYMNCRERLSRRGVAAFNLLTRTRGAAPALARIREAFGDNMQPLPITEAGNVVVLAGARIPAELTAAQLKKAGRGDSPLSRAR